MDRIENDMRDRGEFFGNLLFILFAVSLKIIPKNVLREEVKEWTYGK